MLKARELQDWVKTRFQKQGKRISSEGLGALLDAVGHDPRVLSKEIDKLCLYCHGARDIELKDVAALCPSVRSVREYELTDTGWRWVRLRRPFGSWRGYLMKPANQKKLLEP